MTKEEHAVRMVKLLCAKEMHEEWIMSSDQTFGDWVAEQLEKEESYESEVTK